jgi:hypothetical protein
MSEAGQQHLRRDQVLAALVGLGEPVGATQVTTAFAEAHSGHLGLVSTSEIIFVLDDLVALGWADSSPLETGGWGDDRDVRTTYCATALGRDRLNEG